MPAYYWLFYWIGVIVSFYFGWKYSKKIKFDEPIIVSRLFVSVFILFAGIVAYVLNEFFD